MDATVEANGGPHPQEKAERSAALAAAVEEVGCNRPTTHHSRSQGAANRTWGCQRIPPLPDFINPWETIWERKFDAPSWGLYTDLTATLVAEAARYRAELEESDESSTGEEDDDIALCGPCRAPTLLTERGPGELRSHLRGGQIHYFGGVAVFMGHTVQ